MPNKRTAIITHFHASLNYGGVLQSYALTHLLNTRRYSAEQLRYLQSSNRPQESLITRFLHGKIEGLSLKKVLAFGVSCLSFPFRTFLQKRFVHPRIDRRRKNFDAFNAHAIPSSKEYTMQSISAAADAYDIFISGSDQVWNPNWFHPPYYLHFVPDNKPKIAYAASTAVSSLSDEQYAKMAPLVARFDAISVREENAVELLKGMTDKKISWVLDPTLLLSREEWSNLAGTERRIKEPYVAAYILGDNKANRKAVQRFAKNKNLPLVTFPFVGTTKLWQLSFGDKHCYGGPDEFVSLIRDAEYVLTDSFHAVVFSTIFHKRFVVLKRNADSDKASMNERLYSLFKITGMEHQLCSPDEIDARIEEVNYEGVDERIAVRREESIAWLMRAMEGCKKSE